jgi:hypothetical protein
MNEASYKYKMSKAGRVGWHWELTYPTDTDAQIPLSSGGYSFTMMSALRSMRRRARRDHTSRTKVICGRIDL